MIRANRGELRNAEVVGSTLICSTTCRRGRPLNHRVAGDLDCELQVYALMTDSRPARSCAPTLTSIVARVRLV
jgi:hypothetical protein